MYNTEIWALTYDPITGSLVVPPYTTTADWQADYWVLGNILLQKPLTRQPKSSNAHRVQVLNVYLAVVLKKTSGHTGENRH